MHEIKMATRSRRFGWLLSTALTAALAFGCAAVDDEASEQPRVEETLSDRPDEAPLDDSTDKALRRDWCCAMKLGNHLEACRDMHATKLLAGAQCSFANDNVLRSGQCRTYADCALLGS